MTSRLASFAASHTARALIILLLVCGVGAFIKLGLIGVTDSSDYQEYVAVAHHIAGDTTPEVRPHRFLKPLNPALVALLAGVIGDYQTAFIVQALFFYVALVWMLFFLVRHFIDDIWLATLLAAYVALCYPILRYGVDILTETGALFFYTASLLVTLKYVAAPSWRLLLINTAIVTIGFLWKEYSVVSAIIFGLAILFHPSVSLRDKVLQVAAYAGIFLAVHIPAQIYVYLTYGYSYFSWYSEGVNGAIKQNEFTLRNIVKSTAALLSALWLVVPLGWLQRSSLSFVQRYYLRIAVPVPFMAYAWGYVSSRLLFVMAPPFLLVAAFGMREWTRTAQIAIVGIATIANIAWLFLSYSVKL